MSLNFDFSQLDKLPEGTSAKKGSKFQPKFLAKPVSSSAGLIASDLPLRFSMRLINLLPLSILQRAGQSSNPQAALGKPAPVTRPASQPTAAPAQKKQQAAAPSTSKPAAAAPVQLGIPSKRQPEQPTQGELRKPGAPGAATTRAPKRPRKQAQPLPAAAEFPGGFAIEPESTAGEDNGGEEPYERLRPAASLGARAQARQEAALNPRKRGRPRKTTTAATNAVGIQKRNQEQNGTATQSSGPTQKSARKSTGTTSTAQPSRYRSEAEKRLAGIRRPSRNTRNYDKGFIIDPDEYLYKIAYKNQKQQRQEEDNAERYFNSNGRYETEENEEDGAGPSQPTRKKDKQQRPPQSARAGGNQRKPRKGEPLSTYKTKLKKVGDEKSKRKVASLADQDLDPENWSLKKIVSWAGSRERKLKAEDRRAKIEHQKRVAANIAAGGTGVLEEAALPWDEAGTSADAQQQHPNRRDSAAGVIVRGGGRRGTQATLASPSGAALPTETFPQSGGGETGGLVAPQQPQQQQQQQQQLPRNANLAPQVHMVGGRIVVNRQSLTVQAQEREQYTRVITDDTNRLNSMTYTNRISNERWTTEDTELFYKALSQFGTDFTLISHLFPGRERRHLKNKYTRENKLHPDRIDEAMNQSSNVTLNSYTDMIVMLKESGMAVGAGVTAAEATGAASPSAPAAAAVLNGISSPSNAGGSARPRATRGGNDAATNSAAAPLAITEAGEPASENDDHDDNEAVAAEAVTSNRGRSGRKTRVAVAS